MLVKKIKLKPGYVLREMGGEFNIFSESDKMNGSLVCMPSINELGIALWAELDVGEFLAKLIHAGVVEYEK